MILLAGGIGAGKSSAADSASARARLAVINVRSVLSQVTGADASDRLEMQRRAAALEDETGGRWLVDYLAKLPDQERVIVDAVRTLRQARAALEAFDHARVIYLDADENNRRQRYEMGRVADRMKAASTFDDAMAHPTELEALRLRAIAETVIDANAIGAVEVADIIIAGLDV